MGIIIYPGCSGKIKIENFTLDNSNALQVNMHFETSQRAEAIVEYWEDSPEFDTAISRFYSWTDYNTILALKQEGFIHEFDLQGKSLFDLEYGEKGFSRPLHHEIIRDESKNILSLTRNMKTFNLTGYGGIENDTIYGDGILVLDSTGQRVWEWDI